MISYLGLLLNLSSSVFHHQPDGHFVDELVAGIYFETPHHKYHTYIHVRLPVAHASLDGR